MAYDIYEQHKRLRQRKHIQENCIQGLLALLGGCALAATITQLFCPIRLSGYIGVLAKVGWFHFQSLTGAFPRLALNPHEAAQVIAVWKQFGVQNVFNLVMIFGSVTLWTWVRFGGYFQEKYEYLKRGDQVRSDEHRILPPKQLKKLIAEAVKDKTRPHEFSPQDLTLGREQLQIPDNTMRLHLGLIGASQSGKTNAINQILESRRFTGEKVIIVDLNGDFYARFGRKDDVILSLYDQRAQRWSPWDEGCAPEVLAQAILEVKDRLEGSNLFFQSTGSSVLSSLFGVSHCEPELWKLMNSDEEQLKKLFVENNQLSHRYIGAEGTDQASGVIATSLMNLSFMRDLNHHVFAKFSESLKQPAFHEHKQQRFHPFSIRNWVRDDADPRWVFLVATDSHWEASRHLIRLWMHLASTAILERPVRNDSLPVWVICDELSSVGNLPSLPLLLDRGAKYRGRVILGFQSLAQLDLKYGRAQAKNIIQGLQNLLVFRSTEPEMAKTVSELFGEVEIEESKASFTESSSAKDGMTLSTQTRKVPNVSASQIQSLVENHAFLKLAGFPVSRISFEYRDYLMAEEHASVTSQIPAHSWAVEAYWKPQILETFEYQSWLALSSAYMKGERLKKEQKSHASAQSPVAAAKPLENSALQTKPKAPESQSIQGASVADEPGASTIASANVNASNKTQEELF